MTQMKKLLTNARIGAVPHGAWSFIGNLLDEIGIIISSLKEGNVLVNVYSTHYRRARFVISEDEFRFNNKEPDRTALKREAKEFEELMLRRKMNKKGCRCIF